MSDPLASLAEQLDHLQVVHTRQPLHDGGERLIVASRREPDGLHGNSFWISRRNERWFLVLWSPRAYEVPDDTALADLCAACISCGAKPILSIPTAIVDRYGLKDLGPAGFPDA